MPGSFHKLNLCPPIRLCFNYLNKNQVIPRKPILSCCNSCLKPLVNAFFLINLCLPKKTERVSLESYERESCNCTEHDFKYSAGTITHIRMDYLSLAVIKGSIYTFRGANSVTPVLPLLSFWSTFDVQVINRMPQNLSPL